MGTSLKIISGGQVPASNSAQVPCLLGTCSAGTIGQTYTFTPGQSVSSLGYGKLPSAVLFLLANGAQQVVAAPTTPTFTALPSVVHTASSSGSQSANAPTIAATGSNTGSWDDALLTATISTGGALGAAVANIYYDGYTMAQTVPLPQATPGAVTGTVDLTLGASLDAETLIFSSPSVTTITFGAGSLAASSAGLLAAVALTTSAQTFLASGMLSAGIAALAANPRRLTITCTGSNPPTPATITGTYQGSVVTESLVLTDSAVTSAKTYTTITSVVTTANASATGTIAIGYSDAFASASEVASAFNTLAVSASLAAQAKVFTNASGQQLLQIYTTATGPSATVTFSTSGTADSNLGFSTTSSNTGTGAAAVMTFPSLCVAVTWPSTAAYVAGESFSWTLQGPRSSVSALLAGQLAARNSQKANPFGFFVQVEDCDTNTTAAAASQALDGNCTTWLADSSNPLFSYSITSTAFHTASATLATNDANIATNDASLLAALASTPASNESICVDDCYVANDPSLFIGTARRAATWAGAVQQATAGKIAANPADGIVSGVSLLGPDQLTRARDNGRATTKLDGLSGPGFWALRATSSGFAYPKFGDCATRAGVSSELRDVGAYAIALTIAATVFPTSELSEGQTWATDPTTPAMAKQSITDSKSATLTAFLNPVLYPKTASGVTIQNVSNFAVLVTAPNIANDNKVYVSIPFNPLAVVGQVYVTIAATGVAISGASTAAA